MTPYDHAVIAFYFVFMLAISWVFKRFIRNVSDYFRSGGQVLWWMAGGSAFMVSFSAWTFTGAASRAYGDGWPIMVIYLANALGFLMNAIYFGPRFRQLRVITSMQAVRMRFGRVNEQFFTWLTLPLGTMYAGIWLYGLGVFSSAAFGLDVTTTIVVTGVTVLVISLVGGSWAVIASDFIQVLILMPITIVATILALSQVGGTAAFVERLSDTHLDFGRLLSDEFLLFWCVAIVIKQFISTNNLSDASRYLCVKDSRHARKAALLAAALFFGGIFIWFTPPMAASIVHPDLGSLFPTLKNPAEGSFFAIAVATFPAGMLGLLVSGIFAATMSSMDSGLNKNAGIFVKNFYQPVLRPGASDRELLFTGKMTTITLGVGIILLAQSYSRLQGLSLFQLMLDFGILVALPQTLPLLLGVFIRRTPSWSGWSTVLVGFAVSWTTRNHLTLSWAMSAFGIEPGAVNSWEKQNWDQGVAVFANVVICTSWFLFTRFFYAREPEAYRASIDTFSERIEKPVHYAVDETEAPTDDRQSWLIGWLCVPYGVVVMLLALIPNPMAGRIGFLFAGGVVACVGWALVRQSRPRERQP
jgi:Na+/proline symporter